MVPDSTHTCGSCQRREGGDVVDITQTSKRLPHTRGEEASAMMTPQWGAGKQVRPNKYVKNSA
jgi:hypothetical protein